MEDTLTIPDNAERYLNLLKEKTESGADAVRVAGLSGSARAYFWARFLSDFNRPCLVVLPSAGEAREFLKELRFFMSEQDPFDLALERRLHEIPPYDLTPLTGLSPQNAVVYRRLQALYSLISRDRPVVVTSMEVLSFKTLPKAAFVDALEYLEANEEADRDRLIRKLEITGYRRTPLVEEEGDYSVRGGVVDVFPPLYGMPIRLEFWGDHVESIRQFDPSSQRSRRKLDALALLPATEVIMDAQNLKLARSMGRLPRQPEEGLNFPGREAWLNHFYPRLASVFEYLPQGALVALFEPHRLASASEKMERQFQGDVEKFRSEAGEKGSPFPDVEGLYVPFEEIDREYRRYQRVLLEQLDLDPAQESAETIQVKGHFHSDDDLEVRLAGKGRVSLAPLAERVSQWLDLKASVVMVTRTRQQAGRLREILENYDVHVGGIVENWADVPSGPGITLCLGRLPRGFRWPETGIYVVSEDEIFGPKRGLGRKKEARRPKVRDWSGFSQLQVGDLVVHEEHGIGRYGGLQKMQVQQKVNDFVLIEYKNNDKLYLPADRINILQKYLGPDGKHPRLDQLGGRSWNVAKEKAKKSVKIIAKQLVDLYALRKYRKGFSFSPPDNYFREFEASFEHEETRDQVNTIADVLEDMASEQPMDRLVCGDVGFGKTEVALRAAFKAFLDGKQVAVLVPTTVLAEQHYETFRKRMSPYSVRVAILSRFKARAEQSKIIAQVRSGKVDLLIGTHRMLQNDVRFRDLGLLIIDEEHRFGVKQKEKLKKYRAVVDVLALTATPIPRTLHMSFAGIRDLSIIETPPEDRLSIQSYLSPYDEDLVERAVEFELQRGGQVFFVHNSVQTIDQVADRLSRLMPHVRLAVAHGQMNERDLERTMIRFIHREIDVLVCTTIVESGLDIPAANTIIINEVDKLGLAQIYQLRGRVGRAKDKAFAYLLLSKDAELTSEAEKRLKALLDFSHLGAGLQLAMHDLKIRGTGNILGFAQSGQISAIGYEFYVKLIERGIAELKGEEVPEDINPEINVDMPAFLPDEYVMDTDVRLDLYRRLSGLREKVELENMKEEIRDRFGAPPPEAENLFDLMSVRLLLQKLGIVKLDVGAHSLNLTFSQQNRVDTEKLLSLVQNRPGRFKLLSEDKLKIHTGSLSSLSPEVEKAIEALQ